MNTWNNAPLVRLLFPFIAGCIVAISSPIYFSFSIYVLYVLTAITAVFSSVVKLHLSFKKSWWLGVFVNTTLFLMGYQLTVLKKEQLLPNHFKNYTNNNEYAYLRITEPVVKKNKSVKTVAEVIAVKHNNQWQSTKGKVLVYFKKEDKSFKLNYGDELLVKTKFKPIPPPQNPKEFNYKQFLSHHNIYHQTYLKDGSWIATAHNTGNPIIKSSLYLRDYLLKTIADYGIKGTEYAVASALLLGYEDELDKNLLLAYSKTGVIHILSVSGLHVGIIYLVFNWLFSFLQKLKYGNVLKAILLIFILWFYAALTGLSPSVLRSATMFTFITIAQSFNRHTNIYNTLAASAFLLLLINPFLIMSVGFQLSYIAVIGIAAIHPRLYKIIYFKNYLLDKLWILISISIAAQIVTFPLCLYYFHQFPVYFLLANIVAIPLSTIIIYLGITILVLAKIPVITIVLASVFNYCLVVLNQFIFKIEELPYACVDGIFVSLYETCIIYGIVFLLFFYFVKTQFNYLLTALYLMVLLIVMQLWEQTLQFKQKKIVVYSIATTTAIDFISGKNNVLLTNTSFLNNEKNNLFHIKNNWDNLGINTTTITHSGIKTPHLFIHENFIQFYNKRIIHLKENNQLTKIIVKPPVHIDYLIVSGNCNFEVSSVIKKYMPKLVVFDSSNKPYQLQKWKAECIKMNQPYYSVVDSGALELTL